MQPREGLFGQAHEGGRGQGEGQALDRLDQMPEDRNARPARPVDHLHEVRCVAEVLVDVHRFPARFGQCSREARGRVGARVIRVVTRALERQKEQPIAAGSGVLVKARQRVGVARHVLEHVGGDHDVVVLAWKGRRAAVIRQGELGFVIGAHAWIVAQAVHGARGDLRAMQRRGGIEAQQ